MGTHHRQRYWGSNLEIKITKRGTNNFVQSCSSLRAAVLLSPPSRIRNFWGFFVKSQSIFCKGGLEMSDKDYYTSRGCELTLRTFAWDNRAPRVGNLRGFLHQLTLCSLARNGPFSAFKLVALTIKIMSALSTNVFLA